MVIPLLANQDLTPMLCCTVYTFGRQHDYNSPLHRFQQNEKYGVGARLQRNELAGGKGNHFPTGFLIIAAQKW